MSVCLQGFQSGVSSCFVVVDEGFATTDDGMNCNADERGPVVGDGVGIFASVDIGTSVSFVGSTSVSDGDVSAVVG